MKLQSMTQFVLSAEFKDLHHYDKILNYANFLSRPLELGMFVPCLANDVIQYEKNEPYIDDENGRYWLEPEQLQKAKERVLFEGFTHFTQSDGDIYVTTENMAPLNITSIRYFWDSYGEGTTVEHLVSYDITLTPNAKKLIEG